MRRGGAGTYHEAAIQLSRNLLQYTTLVPLQNIAVHIIEAQTRSIADMEAALCGCEGVKNTGQELCLYQRRFQQITGRMFGDMERACSTNDVNGNFMREMIPHHRGAVQMSENALRFPICPELRPIPEGDHRLSAGGDTEDGAAALSAVSAPGITKVQAAYLRFCCGERRRGGIPSGKRPWNQRLQGLRRIKR
ncbi:MAG: DUF305 domain-containing protein [Intestinimonas sp.]